MKKITLMLLVLVLLLSAVACTPKDVPATDPTPDNTPNDIDEYKDYLDALEVKDYNGKDYNVLSTTQTREFYVVEEENVLLNETIVIRDNDVQKRYNMKLKYNVMDGNQSGATAFTTRIRGAALASGGETFDLVLGQNYYCMSLASEGLWTDLSSIGQLQWDREWYHDNINKSAVISGKQFGGSGEYLMSQTSSSMCLLYNKTLYESNKYEEDIYQLVRDRQWTYEKMNIMVTGLYQDINRSTTRDSEDTYGFLGNSHTVNSIIVGGNCPIASYNDDGTVTVENYYSDRLVNVFNYLFAFFNENPAVRCATSTDSDFPSNVNVDTFSVYMLANGKTLFASTWMGNLAGSEDLKNSSDSIGVVPNPLYDTDQEEYVTYNMRWEMFYIPANADAEYSATILEYLNFTSMRYMLPQYYDNALQLRGADDTADAEMLRIVHDSMYYDFVTVFSQELGGLRDAVAYLIKQNDNGLSSWWGNNSTSYNTTLLLMQDFYS